MKVSVWVSVTDLLPWKKTFFDVLILEKIVKKSIFQINSTDKILTDLKKAGVDGIELLVPSSLNSKEINQLKSIFKKYRLPVLSIHQPLNPQTILKITQADIEQLCQYAKAFHASVITLHLASIGDQIFKSAFVSELHKLEQTYAVKFGLENNPKHPLCLFMPYTWKAAPFTAIVTKKDFSMTYDVTHLAQVNENILDFFITNKNRIINIHLSDYTPHFLNRYLMLSTKTHLPLGHGSLQIDKLLQLVKKNHYQGLITMEINADLKALCESAMFIKSYV